MLRLIIAFSIMVIFTGCVHKMQVVNFETGTTLDAEYNKANKSVKVIMPDGEILTGQYSAMSNASFSIGNTFSNATAYSGAKTASAFGNSTSYGISSGGVSNAYALLRSDKTTLMMEMIVQYSEWTGNGYGEARTNDGRRFKVQF